MNTDPIADLLTRIRNGLKAQKGEVIVPYSNMKHEIVKVLQEEGFVSNYKVEQLGHHKNIIIFLKYTPQKTPVINVIRRISKPGCRVYKGYRDIKPILNGLGVGILSTPFGVFSDQKAKEKKVGGELLCVVY